MTGENMERLNQLAREQMRADLPDFRPGDTVEVHVRIVEGDKERIQVFKGVVIRKRGGLTGATFTVRKVSYGVGVERIFPQHSPNIDQVVILTRGRVRRSRLYYLRQRSGKAARIKEKRVAKVS
jgi:large subunit ribosomal protein L19